MEEVDAEKKITKTLESFGEASPEIQRVLMELTSSEKRFDTPIR